MVNFFFTDYLKDKDDHISREVYKNFNCVRNYLKGFEK